MKLAVFFLFSIFNLIVLLAWYSVSKADRSGVKTSIEIRAAGLVLKFGTEINRPPSQGDRSADEQAQLKTERPPPVEQPPGRRRRLPRKRPPDGGEA